RTWLRTVSGVAQTAIIAALVLSIPFVFRMPAWAPYLATKPLALLFVPPAWFMGLQQVLLGSSDPYFSTLALAALLGTAAVMAIGAACYLIVYQRFDKVILQTAGGRPRLRL